MARIVYALSGQGRGHASRVMAMSDELLQRGHDVLHCCGGTAYEILSTRYDRVLAVPALSQYVRRNKVHVVRTLYENREQILKQRKIAATLAEQLSAFRPDLVITDFEAFAPKAAALLSIPVLTFNHQEIVTRTRYELPPKYRFYAALAEVAINLIAPNDPVHAIVTSFYFPTVKNPNETTLVKPIIRPVVTELVSTNGAPVLVYLNQSSGADFMLDAMRQTDASYIVYNFDNPPAEDRYPNITFKCPDVEGFLADLAACSAVICTAGFTLISEALYLGKPVMAVPNEGIFEQVLNALFLEREGLGIGVFDGTLDARKVEGFLGRRKSIAERLVDRGGSGNGDAMRCIERVLRDIEPAVFPVKSGVEASYKPAGLGREERLVSN